MRKGEKELVAQSTALFLIAILLLNFLILQLLGFFGFTPEVLVMAMAATTIPALFLGYSIARHTLRRSFATNERLSELVKKTLHELNVPVATIRGNTQLLKRKASDPGSLERLERILKATDALLEQYEEVEYAVKQEIREVTREKVELGGLLQQRIELFKGHPSRIPIIQKGEPLYLFVDQRGLATCLDNLLSNAVKYNRSEGQVTAEIRQEHLLIQDNGIGMTPEEVVYIYDRYYQADRTQKGMGIGLPGSSGFAMNTGFPSPSTRKKTREQRWNWTSQPAVFRGRTSTINGSFSSGSSR